MLDNCEHLLQPVRRLVATLMSACTELTVLATSRERLGLPVERICRIAPLALAAHDHGADIEDVPAVAVFLERARRVREAFAPDDHELALIAGIVRRLDGMPLAIELAAGRLASLSLADLAARLDRALDVLGGGTETGDERHSTLRAAIEWSYELLPVEQQRVLRNLAIFPDGFDLATAEAVAAEVAPSVDPTSAVAHLVDASMLEATLGDVPRYWMLDTLRSFGLDRLAAHQEHESAMARFLEWAASFVRWVDDTIVTADEPLANRRLLAELGNLRAAWHHARSADDLDLMAELVTSLHWGAVASGLTEILSWAVELATHPQLVDHPRAASVLGAASNGCWMTAGDVDRAGALAEQGLALASEQDWLSRERCLSSLGDARLFEGRFDEAVALYLEGGDGTPWRDALCASAAMAAAYGGHLDRARAINLEVADSVWPGALAMHHYAAGEIDNLAGAWTPAAWHYREASRVSEACGASFVQALAAVGLVSVQAASGDIDAALRGYAELIDYWERTGAWTQQWTTLRNLADLLDQLEDHDCASLLRRAADEAPEAASTAVVSALDVLERDEVDAPAPAPSPSPSVARSWALDTARQAIARHMAVAFEADAGRATITGGARGAGSD